MYEMKTQDSSSRTYSEQQYYAHMRKKK